MNRKKATKRASNHLAQAAVELAIFGAILMFVIGLIMRTGLTANHSMDTQLRALRLALSESYRTSEGHYGSQAARNTAGIFLLEDRLAAGFGSKMGTRDRSPYMAGSSATFSRNLFYPINFEEEENLPIYDVFVNGQRFPFSAAAFRTVVLSEAGGEKPEWIPECPNPAAWPDIPSGICWENDCVAAGGCAIMYKMVWNYESNDDWDATIEARFDLDLDGTIDVTEDSVRQQFGWQWMQVAGIRKGAAHILDGATYPGIDGMEVDDSSSRGVDVDGDRKSEAIDDLVFEGASSVVRQALVMDSQEGDIDFSIDDSDTGDWRVMEYGSSGTCPDPEDSECTVGEERIEDDGDCKWKCMPRSVGIKEDVAMYTYTRADSSISGPGTWYRMQSGQLFDVDGQFVRQTNRQDSVDIISRPFYISNDTGRFCSGGTPTVWPIEGMAGLTNPVEACGSCFSGVNASRTCFDQDEKIIYIRSRIHDIRGRRWVTRFNP
ncbi:MAG: hypothetical protein KAJ18_06360 [Candidatus Omnitrophica bacterium]|nr:hypothetical protein [Candidatus Omnitrophota bacterium]